MKIKFLLIVLLFSIAAHANNMLVQNVTTLNNDPVNKTIQVQFDISWDNSWRDSINYDAAWVFIKFKDANGLWQHAQLNQTGFNLGTGTADSVKVTSDKVGTWVYRSGLGSGTFNVTGMQLQWNYGLSGLTSVAGLEVRVFAVEMVFVPDGDFNVAKIFINTPTIDTQGSTCNAPGSNIPVINNRLSPLINYNDGTSVNVKIKGDVGIDVNNDNIIDNTTYPIGYFAFYVYKYELTEQQYADFLNTLNPNQITALGIASSSIIQNNGQYFSSTPNKACGNSSFISGFPPQINASRLFAYADWSGLRPLSFLEFNKASYGPRQPQFSLGPNSDFTNLHCNYSGLTYGYPVGEKYNMGPLANVGSYANSTSNSSNSSASYYGVLDLTGNAHEPVIRLSYLNYSNINGNGLLNANGTADVSTWINSSIIFIDMIRNTGQYCSYIPGSTSIFYQTSKYGFRYVRSAE